MFDLTILDFIYVGTILASTVWATIRGGIYETIATLSWIAAAVSARFVSPYLDKLFQSWFELSDSTVGTLVASYFIVFFAVLLIVGFVNQKLRNKIQESIMNVTDHTLGVIFGIIRGVFVMGFVYWGLLWYYSDAPKMPTWVENARTRPLMQITAVKINEWFIPGKENKLLMRDVSGTREAMDIYQNLINPAVTKGEVKEEPKEETGYKSSERTSLENQLLQIETVARTIEKHTEESPQTEEE